MVCIVMPLYKQTLTKYYTNENTSENKMLEKFLILEKICMAIEYIHQNGYIHLDIKPDSNLNNLMKYII